jgi:hypothetical protein
MEVPDGVDPSFLAALPEDMRQEVIAEHLRFVSHFGLKWASMYKVSLCLTEWFLPLGIKEFVRDPPTLPTK